MAALMQTLRQHSGGWGHRCRWELGRALRSTRRRVGVAGAVVAGAVLVIASAGAAQRWATTELLRVRTAAAQQATVAATSDTERPLASDTNTARLAAFERVLVAPDDLPTVVQDLFAAADKEGLTLARGEYRAQPEDAGGFRCWRLALPVSGDAAAVQRFIARALQVQPALGLEHLQIKRESGSVTAIEARLDWVVYVRAPRSSDVAVAGPDGGSSLHGGPR